MKKIYIIILTVFSFTVLSSFTNKKIIKETTNSITIQGETYCDGWSDGYKDGWCYGKGVGCLSPLVPLCPLRRLNEEDSYKAGYQRGFLRGQHDNNPE